MLSLFGMMNWIYKWHNPKLDPATEELTEVIFTIFLRGVLAPNGAAREAQAIEARVLEKV